MCSIMRIWATVLCDRHGRRRWMLRGRGSNVPCGCVTCGCGRQWVGARQGLVVTWRRVQRGASPPSWQALVVVVDDRSERAEAQWFFATELEPVPSDPPGA